MLSTRLRSPTNSQLRARRPKYVSIKGCFWSARWRIPTEYHLHPTLHQSPTKRSTATPVSTNQTCSNVTSLNKIRGSKMMWRSSHFSTGNYPFAGVHYYNIRQPQSTQCWFDADDAQLQIVWIESRGGNELFIPRCSHGLLYYTYHFWTRPAGRWTAGPM